MVVNIKNSGINYIERTATVNQYFSEVRKFDSLTAEDEKMLFSIIKNSSDPVQVEMAKKKIAECNQKFVISVANHYAPSDKFLDCVSEGTIGLMLAIDEFDPDKNVKFITFAVHYIRREITQYLRDEEPSIKKTNISKTYHTVAQARNEFLQTEEREPTSDELVEILNEKYNVEIKDVSDITDMRIISIDEPISDEDDETSISNLQMFNDYCSSSNDYETTSAKAYNSELLSTLFNVLTPREQKVISMLFGLGYEREYEPKEVAEEVGLTPERVRQMRSSIVTKLQTEFMKRNENI